MVGSIYAMIDNSKWFKQRLDNFELKVEAENKNEGVRKNLIEHILDIEKRIEILNEAWEQFIQESEELI